MPQTCCVCNAKLSISQKSPQPMKLNRALDLRKFLDTVPQVKYAFAYGSGVFQQHGLYEDGREKVDRPMLDFILAVDDPIEWHDQNIINNRAHYSSLAWGGGRSVVCNSEKLGAGVHFNPAVSWGNEVVKYGVIRKSLLHKDLIAWNQLYVAGRMQKPILPLIEDDSIEDANRQNRISSLVASLLLLPEKFTDQDLHRAIVGLSYLGDVRMGLAEDSRKVDRIASSSSEGLEQIYKPLLKEAKGVSSRNTGASELWEQDFSPEARTKLICKLPEGVQGNIARQIGNSGASSNFAEIADKLARSRQYRDKISQAIASIVGPSSRGQAVAGLFMAGPARSAWYVMQKMKKKYLQ